MTSKPQPMLDLGPTERSCLRALLELLADGERIAADCAARQAELCDGRLARFFRAQSQQERMHAWVFDTGIARLGGARGGTPPDLAAYRALVEAHLAAGDLPATVVATQVVLEGLGRAVLKELEEGLERRRSWFGGLCRLLLRQEQAHHAFGVGFVARTCDAATLTSIGADYAALGRRLIEANAHLLDGLSVERDAFRAAFESALPAPLCSQAT